MPSRGFASVTGRRKEAPTGVEGNRTQFHNANESNELQHGTADACAKSYALSADDDLRQLVELWPSLSFKVRRQIVRLARRGN